MLQGGSSPLLLTMLLCLCAGDFICDICFVIICSSSLLVCVSGRLCFVNVAFLLGILFLLSYASKNKEVIKKKGETETKREKSMSHFGIIVCLEKKLGQVNICFIGVREIDELYMPPCSRY